MGGWVGVGGMAGQLPAGWAAAVDGGSGRTFYFHAAVRRRGCRGEGRFSVGGIGGSPAVVRLGGGDPAGSGAHEEGSGRKGAG